MDDMLEEMEQVARHIEFKGVDDRRDLAQKIDAWRDRIDDSATCCGTCDEHLATIRAMEMELIDAVDNFAEFEKWRIETGRITTEKEQGRDRENI